MSPKSLYFSRINHIPLRMRREPLIGTAHQDETSAMSPLRDKLSARYLLFFSLPLTQVPVRSVTRMHKGEFKSLVKTTSSTLLWVNT